MTRYTRSFVRTFFRFGPVLTEEMTKTRNQRNIEKGRGKKRHRSILGKCKSDFAKTVCPIGAMLSHCFL